RPPAPPRPAGPVRPAAPPEADNPAARALTYLRLHWLTILFCGALLGAGLAYAAWCLLPPKYESVAMFRVSQGDRSVTGGDARTASRSEFTTYVKSTASLIQTEDVYAAAMRDTKYLLSELPTIRQQKDPYKFFDEKLIVSSKEGSEIIKMTLAGENPDDMRKIVQAITDAYMKEVVYKEKDQRKDQRDAIAKAKLTLENQLRARLGLGTEAGPVVAGAQPPADRVIPAGGPQPPDPTALRPAGGGVASPLDTGAAARFRGGALDTAVVSAFALRAGVLAAESAAGFLRGGTRRNLKACEPDWKASYRRGKATRPCRVRRPRVKRARDCRC
ncbi:MAG: hypothetical protein ABGY75_17420, partial [Gemmataceae bacterium]